MSNYVQNYALVVMKNILFSFILHKFRCLFSLKRLRTKKGPHLLFVYVLTDLSTHNIHIGRLKHIITNLTIESTHYVLKSYTKNTNYGPKLGAKLQIMRLIVCYAPKAKLCVQEPIARFFKHLHNQIILKGLI